nr:sialic acid-binding Ig-like lectin 13 isoform X2 [Doryrhamphus excisus]XP_057908174.1 sialic acid-binding Ig-like lectin 13 isoform X2 [Doryrhamphus excisus]
MCGQWTKGDSYPSTIVYDNCLSFSDYSLILTGRLDQQNCTMMYNNTVTQHSGAYFLQLYNHVTVVGKQCEPVYIQVEEQPWQPTIHIPVVELKVNKPITISCSAFTPCPASPPVVKWRHTSNNQQHLEQLPDGTFMTKLQDTLVLTEKYNGYILECSSVYYVHGRQEQTNSSVTLNVLFAPKDTKVLVSPSGPVLFGTYVVMNCSSRANPASNFTWWVKEEGGTYTPMADGECTTWNVTKQEEIYCVAANSVGQQASRKIRLEITGQPGDYTRLIVGGIVVFIVFVALVLVYTWWSRRSRSWSLRPAKKEAPKDITMVAFNQDGVYNNGINVHITRDAVQAEGNSDNHHHQQSVHAQVYSVPNIPARII